jgi:hypothetical protein
MIENTTTIEQIETSVKVIGSKVITNIWNNVKDNYEEAHWVSAFNFKLNQFIEDPYIVLINGQQA